MANSKARVRPICTTLFSPGPPPKPQLIPSRVRKQFVIGTCSVPQRRLCSTVPTISVVSASVVSATSLTQVKEILGKIRNLASVEEDPTREAPGECEVI
jgi:hypothetical protein